MTETSQSTPAAAASPAAESSAEGDEAPRRSKLRIWSVVACAVLGFLLVTQLSATEDLGARLDVEREEDLAQILADLSTQSDRLQEEITSLRLTLLAFENSAESEDLALQSLQGRLNDLRILAGTVEVEGPGVTLTVADPQSQVSQELLVDTVQELRDAGAEAVAVNDIRLVASSAFTTRNGKVLLDDQPLRLPITIAAIGPAQTIAEALAIPGGALDALESRPEVNATVEMLEQMTLAPRPEPVPFVFGDPVPADRAP